MKFSTAVKVSCTSYSRSHPLTYSVNINDALTHILFRSEGHLKENGVVMCLKLLIIYLFKKKYSLHANTVGLYVDVVCIMGIRQVQFQLR